MYKRQTSKGGKAECVDFNDRFERDGMVFPEPTPDMFNFNNPVGACGTCEGYGHVLGMAPLVLLLAGQWANRKEGHGARGRVFAALYAGWLGLAWALQLRASASLKSTHAAVLGWRENVDLEFDGVEPCPICYGVLHPKSKRLPHLECRQCHNKFHASCLAHWFSTSHKHLCVVCQTEFVAVKSTKKDPKRDAPPPPPAAPAAPLYDDNELD